MMILFEVIIHTLDKASKYNIMCIFFVCLIIIADRLDVGVLDKINSNDYNSRQYPN